MFYTYAHTKPDGTIFYIGKGTGIRAWKTTRRNQHWKNIVAKYKDYNVEILANWDTEKEALDHEILLISCFRDMRYNLANMTNGGEGTSGYKHTKEWKQKATFAWSGNKNQNFGKQLSEKTKQKISSSIINKNLRGTNAFNFKCPIVATNIINGQEIILSGTAEMKKAGFQTTNIFKCLKGERKLHKGHTFKRLEI